MMRKLILASTISPLCLLLPATTTLAQTVVDSERTTPVATDNADIEITEDGSIEVGSGAAVTVNTSNDVSNDGAISIIDSSSSTGVLVNPGLSATITNSGSIVLDEDYDDEDEDDDGDSDGPLAQGSDRFGIRVLGPATFTGTIETSGTISVEGNDSAGIAIEGPLAGSLLQTDGSIAIVGDNSFGISAGAVSGDVRLVNGSISAQGENSVAVSLTGDIGGALVIQSSISATGYDSTSQDVDELDADDILQGGPALDVSGNVAGGILFDVPPEDQDGDEDDDDDDDEEDWDADGVADVEESTASLSAYGAAPAVRIGSATQNLTIGAVQSSPDGHGMVFKGSITSSGYYDGIESTAVSIAGLGGRVDVAGGLTNEGSISATAGQANAAGVRIGSGGSLPELVNSGTIWARTGGLDSARSAAIQIDSGGSLTTIFNSGAIGGAINASGDDSDEYHGTAAAIVDRSGTLTLIENSGTLSISNASGLGDQAIAFDLSANVSGVTVRQFLSDEEDASSPRIDGVMLFGSGNDLLDVSDGLVNGDARFGAGDNGLALAGDAAMSGAVTFGAGSDVVQLSGTSSLTGSLDFGGGADHLNLTGSSSYRGTLSNSDALAVTVGAGSALHATNVGVVRLGSLSTGENSTLGVAIGNGIATSYDVAGVASFAPGTSIEVTATSLDNVAGTYSIIAAETLEGVDNLSTSGEFLPLLFTGDLVTGNAGSVNLDIRLKTPDELSLNSSEGVILGSVIAVGDADEDIAETLLEVEDEAALKNSLQQMLPEHSGGAFETVTKGSRLTAGILSDPRAPVIERGDTGVWVQQVAWGTSKSIGSTSSYDLTGWGLAGGLERNLSLGRVGLSLAYLTGRDGGSDRELASSQYEAGLYWRGGSGPLHGFARATIGAIGFEGYRTFNATNDGTEFTRRADGDWNARLYSLSGGASYEIRSGRLTIRPSILAEHYRLVEDGYTETGGGEAYNLSMENRKSAETAATGLLTLGYDFAALTADNPWLRVELEGGRRQILSGSLGQTRARFEGGDIFALTPEKRTSGWRAALRVAGGDQGVTLSGEVSGEEQQGRASIGARLGLQLAF